MGLKLKVYQYALDGRNASTLKYLLTKVKDIDVYEPDSTGLPR